MLFRVSSLLSAGTAFGLIVAPAATPAEPSAVPVVALTFAPGGTALVSNGDRCIDLRSPRDATIERSIPCELPKITCLAFSPKGEILAAGGGEAGVRGEVQLLSWPGGSLIHRFGDHTDLVPGISFDPDNALIAVASSDHTVSVWRWNGAEPPALLFTLTGHAGPVLAVAFTPSGSNIVTASADRSLKVWDPHDGTLVRSLSHHTEAIHALAFRPIPSGEGVQATCATASSDRTVRIWQPETGRMQRIIRRHDAPAFALAWMPDGSSLFSAGKEGIIRRIDAGSDAILDHWQAQDDWIYALAVHPAGHTLASSSWSGSVLLHSISPADSP